MNDDIKLNLNYDGQVEDWHLILSYIPHDHLGQLTGVTDFNCTINLNAPDEISFTLYRDINDYHKHCGNKDCDFDGSEPLFDYVNDFMLIYVRELNEYFSIEVTNKDEDTYFKNIVGTGAAEMELSQAILQNFEINTEADIRREDYDANFPTVFYDPDHPEASLLHRVLYELPQWRIRHVDTSLRKINRMFSAHDESVYDFLTQTVAADEGINCLFRFDSVRREINAYDLKTTCLECGYRGTYHLICPECGSTLVQEYGEDTQIYFDTENFSKSITYETDTDAVKNCFYLEAGDDAMTNYIKGRNPNGSSYIYYFSEECKRDMPKELVKKLDEYDELYNSYWDEWKVLQEETYDMIDKELYYEHSMMPGKGEDITKRNMSENINGLTVANLSPLAIVSLTRTDAYVPTVSQKTMENGILNYAKLFYQSGFYKATINTESWNQPDWYGTITLTSYADPNESATTMRLHIVASNNYDKYMEQRIDAYIKQKSVNDKYGNIYEVFKIKDYNSFVEAIKAYSYNRLQAFKDSYQGALDILREADQTRRKAEMEETAKEYQRKMAAIEAEMMVREKQIQECKDRYAKAYARMKEIMDILNFEKFIGEDLWLIFLMFRREATYKNSNYISDGLDVKVSIDDETVVNSKIIDNCDEFIEKAKEKLIQSGSYQHTISGRLIDFMALPEFQPFVDKVQLGNWVNIRIGYDVYRLRLLSIGLDFTNLENIDLTFSDVEKIRDGMSDVRSILGQAKKMASSFGSVENKVDSGKDRDNYVDDWVGRGLDMTKMVILDTADHQQFWWDEHGIWMRRYDPYTDTFDPELVRIINNGLYYSMDNGESISAGIGHFYFPNPKHNFEWEHGYGLLAEMVVGRMILSEDVGIWTENGHFQMDKNGFYMYVGENFNGSNPYFLIERKTSKDSNKYTVMEISDQRIYLNMPGGTIQMDGGNINLNASSHLNLKGSDINMNGGNISIDSQGDLNLAAGSRFTLQGGELNFRGSNIYMDAGADIKMSGSNLEMSGGNILIDASGDLTLKAGSSFTLQSGILNFKGSEINMEATNINMAGLVDVNGKFSIDKSGNLVAQNAQLKDVHAENLYATGEISIEDAKYGMAMRDGWIRVGTTDINTATSRGCAFDWNGNGWVKQGLRVGGSENYAGNYTLIVEGGSAVIKYGNLDIEQGHLYCKGDIFSEGTVSGSGSVEASLDSVTSYASLNTSMTVSDQGLGEIAEDGLCYVYATPKFLDTVSGEPVVFAQGYGSPVELEEVTPVYFVAKGEPGTRFSWNMTYQKKDANGAYLNPIFDNLKLS